jgi:hypothetical protein
MALFALLADPPAFPSFLTISNRDTAANVLVAQGYVHSLHLTQI